VAEAKLRALEPLLGEWTLQAGPPDGPPWPGGGRMSFELIEEGALLLQRWSIDLPEAPDGVAVIGFDAEKERYVQLYTDERGVHRIYEMSFAGGEWRLWRDGDQPFPQRFTGRLAEDGQSIAGRWEKQEDGEWSVDFDMTYTRVAE
jgi:hypothetical protein